MRSLRSISLQLARGVHRNLPKDFSRQLAPIYEKVVLELGSEVQDGLIVDIGSGFITPAIGKTGLSSGATVIGLDISPSALLKNCEVDLRLVADACKQWPFRDGSVDMVVSRSVMEHLPDTDMFARECRRVLKPGGVCVNLLPGRNAPFSLLNRILPNRISRRLLERTFPWSKDELGFPVFYNHCSFPQIQQLFESNGLVLEFIRFRYYQSNYFAPFFPLYLVSVLYDLLVWKLGITKLCSQILVIVRQPLTPLSCTRAPNVSSHTE